MCPPVVTDSSSPRAQSTVCRAAPAQINDVVVDRRTKAPSNKIVEIYEAGLNAAEEFSPRISRMGTVEKASGLIRVHPCHPWFNLFFVRDAQATRSSPA
jgi:hypothetical protein